MHRTNGTNTHKQTKSLERERESHSWAPKAESIQLIRTFSYDLNLQIVNMVSKLNQPLVKDRHNETKWKK